jgi:hypothetical protein
MTAPPVVPNVNWGESPILTAPSRSPRSPQELALSFGSESSVTSADLTPSSDHGYEGVSIDPDLFHPDMTAPGVDMPPELARALTLGLGD